VVRAAEVLGQIAEADEDREETIVQSQTFFGSGSGLTELRLAKGMSDATEECGLARPRIGYNDQAVVPQCLVLRHGALRGGSRSVHV